MKKYLLLIMTVAIIFFSCKKENADKIVTDNPTLSKTLYPVVFNFSVLQTNGVKTNSLSTLALKDQIKYLHYFVFSGPFEPINELKPFKQKTQKSTDQNFGNITDSLPAGQYSIFFVGAQALGNVSMERKIATDLYGVPIFYYNNSSIYDTFNKRLDLIVSAPVNQAVELTRITTKITIKLTDQMPANAATIKVSFEDFPVGADLLLNIGNHRPHSDIDPYPTATFSFPVNDDDKGKTGFTLSTLVWPHFYPTISIDCIGLNGELIAHKELSRAIPQLNANTNYIFSGKLFSQSAFSITINDEWNAPVNVPFSLPSAISTN
ncbi:hypothetical protein [Mucilaginibacter sp.]|uniref:hypothetical protein n=1 Tax=Mucilaginibacter sp. TaxID=1882438 RepID=UPI003562509F